MRLLARGKSVTALAFRQDGRQLAVGDSDGRAVTLWNLPSESSLMLGGPAGSHVTTADSVCWSPDGSLLATGTKTSCHLWDAWTGERIHLFEGRPPIAFSADSERLLTGSAVIDLATGVVEEGGSADPDAFLQESGSIQGDGRWISPVSPDRKIMVAKGNSLAIVTFPAGVESGRLIGHRGYVYGAGFSGDGRWIVSGGADRSVRIWDARSCEQVGALAAGVHPDTVMCAAFSPDGTRIATGCRDNLVRIFDAETKELLLELAAHRSHIAAIQWSPDGTRIASASGDATARIWDAVPRQERFAQARSAATLRAELFPRVERLLHELGDPAAVATRLRGDSTLVGVRRQAALRVLLRLALQR